MTYADNDIDWEAFLELTESEVKSLVPKLGTAKRILRLQSSVVCLTSMFFVTLLALVLWCMGGSNVPLVVYILKPCSYVKCADSQFP